MTVYKAAIPTSEADGEILTGLLAETLDPAPAISVSETPSGCLLEIYFEGRPDPAALAALLADHPAATILRDLALEPVPEENWVEKSQRDLHPVEAGRFSIHGSHDRARAGTRFAIEIDAGQAFGTAHHGTTRGCLLMLDRLAKLGQVRRMLDLGTGSGVLAVAAAKSLCRNVIATDIDPVAVQVAAENFARNGVAHRVRTVTAAGLRHAIVSQYAPFDLVTANILAAPLISLAPGIRRVMAPGGQLILSGLLDSQAREVSASYIARGFVHSAHLSLDGWATLLLAWRPETKKPP
jgi:ribosomal protein L11 methyltransferase